MLTKDQYVKAVKVLDRYIQKDLELYSTTNGMIDTTKFDELNDLVIMFESLLETLTKDYDEKDIYHISNLGYFLYDVAGGRESVEGDGSSKVVDENGISLYIRTAEELYDNFILPKYTQEDFLKSINTEAFAEDILNIANKYPTKEEMIKFLKEPFREQQ